LVNDAKNGRVDEGVFDRPKAPTGLPFERLGQQFGDLWGSAIIVRCRMVAHDAVQRPRRPTQPALRRGRLVGQLKVFGD
jgi:hypothetical protein